MRRLAIGTIFAMVAGAAQAEVNSDLVFCAKQRAPAERLACYDAIGRIANPSARTAPATSKVLVSRDVADRPPIPAPAEPSRSAFDGAYIAAGGSYGSSSSRTASVFGFSRADVNAAAAGPGASAALGYNISVGQLLWGLELSGRWGNETGTDRLNSVQNGFFVGQELLSYSVKSDGGAHLSLRAGVILDQTLLFARAGIGAAHTTQNWMSDSRAACSYTGAFPPVCTPGALLATAVSAWTPSFLVGAGVEQNFGAFFARAEGQAEVAGLAKTVTNIGTAENPFWTTRAIVMVGVRF